MTPERRGRAQAALLAATLLLAGCGHSAKPHAARPAPPPLRGQGAVVWAVGDGSRCNHSVDNHVAAMIERDRPRRFLFLGDVYSTGSSTEFKCYTASYGRFRDFTFPTLGNHEGRTGFVGYFRYWHRRLHDRRFYSAPLPNGWRVISLDSDPSRPWGPGRFAAQRSWLARQLRGPRRRCTIAILHRPPLDAGWGDYRGDAQLAPLWDLLRGRVPLVLTGHVHDYQRIVPLDGPDTTLMVVGTGGAPRYENVWPSAGLRMHDDNHYGALRLVLRRGRADFQFRAVGGKVIDRGVIPCRSGRALPGLGGRPDPLPPGVVARVGHVTVSRAEYRHWLGVIGRSQQQDMPLGVSTRRQPLPAVHSSVGQALRVQTMRFLISAAWTTSVAELYGIRVTPQETHREANLLRSTNTEISEIAQRAQRERHLRQRSDYGVGIRDWLVRGRIQALVRKLLARTFRGGRIRAPEARARALRGFLRRVQQYLVPRTRCAPGFVIPACRGYRR